MNEKTSWNQALLQKSHQKNKQLGIPSCKILGTIFKMDEGGTQTNREEGKKVDDDAQGFTSEGWHRLYVSRKGGRRVSSTEYSMNASISGLEDNIKKSKEGLITAVNISTDNIKINRTTITGKQKWEGKTTVWIFQ